MNCCLKCGVYRNGSLLTCTDANCPCHTATLTSKDHEIKNTVQKVEITADILSPSKKEFEFKFGGKLLVDERFQELWEYVNHIRAADRAALIRRVERMYMHMAVFPGSPYTLQWKEAYNKALQEVVAFLHSPEKK